MVDLVAHDDERREREPAAALHDLGDAVDLHDPLLQVAAGDLRPAGGGVARSRSRCYGH
jgi:hypothetical protein